LRSLFLFSPPPPSRLIRDLSADVRSRVRPSCTGRKGLFFPLFFFWRKPYSLRPSSPFKYAIPLFSCATDGASPPPPFPSPQNGRLFSISVFLLSNQDGLPIADGPFSSLSRGDFPASLSSRDSYEDSFFRRERCHYPLFRVDVTGILLPLCFVPHLKDTCFLHRSSCSSSRLFFFFFLA